eukprot:TRINITY_DN1367_c4_g1_i3.p1 TRINITY_DN1367_c4_g1~~TRINITY_DN1367_c4_g1_i3.p1  ORF type:complete len:677 (+),score=120.06 TRINITY_DN1367_c4_g1_i3:71-2032(+)
MGYDPFSNSNPFGNASGNSTAPKSDNVFEQPAVAKPEPAPAPVEQEQTVSLVFDDDPFTIKSRPPVASTPSPRSQSPEQPKPEASRVNLHIDTQASSPRGSIDYSSPSSPQSPSSVTDLERRESSSKTLDSWKSDAITWGNRSETMSMSEMRDTALETAKRNRVTVEPALIRSAESSEDALSKLTSTLRVSKTGVPYNNCSRVEVGGATRIPGKGMEIPYWSYSFKLYTTLPDYKDQPHYEDTAESKCRTIKNIQVISFQKRYRDFEWLRKCLVIENPAVVVPPIPDKTLQSLKEKVGKKDGSFVGEDLEDAGADKGKWQSDKDVNECNECGTRFGMVTRKHHCRHCMKIFCSTCCPKPSGGKRFCLSCASLTGLSEMLQKNPDVAYRMKGFHLFLSECFAGPLAYSDTLRFFIEAPEKVFWAKKDSMLKTLETEHQVYAKSVIDMAKTKVSGVQSWWKGVDSNLNGLTPRRHERRSTALRFVQYCEMFALINDHVTKQLFDGLKRNIKEASSLPSAFKSDPDLLALAGVASQLDECLGSFKNQNKDSMFQCSIHTHFLCGVLTSAIELLQHFDRLQSQISKVDPDKMTKINDFIASHEEDVKREIVWMQRTLERSFKKICAYIWEVELNRDISVFDWGKISSIASKLKDPVF